MDFSKFTRLYELSKTLRFELKPVGNTQKMLEDNEVFKKDQIVDKNYHSIKYYFDVLHREFVKESLEGANLDYQEYYLEFKRDQKSNALIKIEVNLRKELVKLFDRKANQWKEILEKKNIKLKQNGIDILFEKNNLQILKFVFQKHGSEINSINILTGKEKVIEDNKAPVVEIEMIDGKKKNLFESFEGFQGYLTNFHQSRKNFYSKEDKTTAISNRAINENLRRFCANLKQFEEKREEYMKLEFTQNEAAIFDLSFYNKCLIQEGIDRCNEIIGRKSSEEGERGINQKINEFNQKNKGKKLKQFKSLYKQILSLKEQKIDSEIKNDEEVFIKMREFIILNDKKNAIAEKIIADFIKNQDKYDVNEIYVKGLALNTISGKWFSSWATIGEKIMTGKGETKKPPDFISFGNLKNKFDENENVKAEDLFKKEYCEIGINIKGY